MNLNKNIKSLLIIVLATIFTVACSKDEDEPINVAVTYKGYTFANSNYFHDQLVQDNEIIVGANDDGTYSISMPSYGWGAFSGSYNVLNATLQDNGGVYTLSGKGIAKMGMNGNMGTYPCTITATIRGAEATFKILVPEVMGGFSIAFTTGKYEE